MNDRLEGIDFEVLQAPVSETEHEDIFTLLEALSSRLHDRDRVRELVVNAVDNPSQRNFVARYAGRIVGMAFTGTMYSPTGAKTDVEDVVVHPEFEKRGIASRLIELCNETADENNATSRLTSRQSRDVAQRVYQRHGYAPKDTVYFERPRKD